MKYPTIHIEGAILSGDIIDRIEKGDLHGQTPADFTLDGPVKDEIARAWAEAQQLWQIYQRRLERLKPTDRGTTETRNNWVVPLLGLLGYKLEYQQRGETVNNRTYAISHRDPSRGDFHVHIMGCRDSLDRKREDGGPRMSPHGLVQEYLNLTEHLYAIATNGNQLRLLRDSTRLVRLSYIEFDLKQMFEEGHFADFAILFRLLHSTRMPLTADSSAESLIEQYHQDALESGSRIRDGLSKAVENSIKTFANGFLRHPDNDHLREAIRSGQLEAKTFYQYQLRLIYRLLFLMVIEERNLVYPDGSDKNKRDLYTRYYSVSRLRKLAGKRHLADARYKDLWIALKNTFRLFENEKYGKPLGIKPLAGDLFSSGAIRHLNICSLDNRVLIQCLTNLSIFENPDTRQRIRVNYAALNVEEFGSVYEGLLEYDPQLTTTNGELKFSLVKGDARASSGSHYTPDELVTPLIRNSLDHIIKAKLNEAEQNPNSVSSVPAAVEKEKALLSIKVCDVACGSGHILLNAARRIGTELAIIRTGEEQPSPKALREAVRDVIRHCIYGVDLNPMAVELCKVALWLESHNPDAPLGFLDHHIKCGNAIVGLAHADELERGIPNEAFKRLPGDDKDVCARLRNGNKKQRNDREKGQQISYGDKVGRDLRQVLDSLAAVTQLPEHTPEEVAAKQAAYNKWTANTARRNLKIVADAQVAQFFILKTPETQSRIITDETYFRHLRGELQLAGTAIAESMAVAHKKKFFHWFLEFPEVFAREANGKQRKANGPFTACNSPLASTGFDCILGNPPYLGGQKLTGTFGNNFAEYIKYQYAPIGSVDLVAYFFRRIFTLIRQSGFQALISTNTIAQGDTRNGGLAVIEDQGGTINFAVRSMRWPGLAAVEVALVGIYKGKWSGPFLLDNKKVEKINSYLDDSEYLGEPYKLKQNEDKSFQGSIVLGRGFILTPEEAQVLIAKNPKNRDVLFPYLNGDDLNNRIDQSPSRWVINFFDWTEDYCRKNYPEVFAIIEAKVKPERMQIRDRKSNLNSRDKRVIEVFWQYEAMRPKLYRTIAPLERVLGISRVSKYALPSIITVDIVTSEQVVVFALDKYFQFAILSNTYHDMWAWKNCSTMGGVGLRYTPSDGFQTFPIPQNISSELEEELESIGKEYHEFRKQLMRDIQLGLTKTYNQFHNAELTKCHPGIMRETKDIPKKEFIKKFGKETYNLVQHLNKTENACDFDTAVAGIVNLRALHKEMDEAVLKAYGWHQESTALQPLGNGKTGVKEAGAWPAIDLRHDFYEVEYLPENDRIRYTIHPDARKEILKRLLLLNHKIYAEEAAAGLHDKKKPNHYHPIVSLNGVN